MNTSTASIVEEEEGAVLYLVMRSPEHTSINDRVLSLTNIETLEYRIFHKMGEKLRNLISGNV